MQPLVKLSLLALGALALGLTLGSCRATKGLLGDPDAEVRSSVNWVAIPTFDPVNPADTKIFVKFRNPAGATEFTYIGREIEAAAAEYGYTITRNPDEADFYYEVMIRFFDENPNGDNGESLLNNAGAIAVGAAGWAAADAMGGGNLAKGGTAIVLGAGAKTAFDNFSRVTEWNLLVDCAIGERMEGGVNTRLQGGQDAHSSIQTGQNTGYQGTGGSDVRNTGRHQSAQTTSDFFRHEARLLAVSRQIRMTREEAVAALSERVRACLPEILP